VVLGNEQRLAQVFHNLIENAVQYSQKGGAVQVEAVEEAGRIKVRIADEGIGIPAEDIPRLFERFYRVEARENETVPGAGLGLYVVRQLLAQMGGEIDVDSAVGCGSTFTVTLPMAAQEQAA
jgi:two-component system, OmpR family, phosphate regulon sensor histidine kinase PhoR